MRRNCLVEGGPIVSERVLVMTGNDIDEGVMMLIALVIAIAIVMAMNDGVSERRSERGRDEERRKRRRIVITAGDIIIIIIVALQMIVIPMAMMMTPIPIPEKTYDNPHGAVDTSITDGIVTNGGVRHEVEVEVGVIVLAIKTTRRTTEGAKRNTMTMIADRMILPEARGESGMGMIIDDENNRRPNRTRLHASMTRIMIMTTRTIMAGDDEIEWKKQQHSQTILLLLLPQTTGSLP